MSGIFLVRLSEGRALNIAHVLDFTDESENGKSSVSVLLTSGEEYTYEGEDAEKIFTEIDYFIRLSDAMKAQYAHITAASVEVNRP